MLALAWFVELAGSGRGPRGELVQLRVVRAVFEEVLAWIQDLMEEKHEED